MVRERYIVVTIIFGVLGICYFCAGLFLFIAAKKLAKVQTCNDMFFGAVQKINYLLSVGVHRRFIEDKDELVKSAGIHGFGGIISGFMMTFVSLYSLCPSLNQ